MNWFYAFYLNPDSKDGVLVNAQTKSIEVFFFLITNILCRFSQLTMNIFVVTLVSKSDKIFPDSSAFFVLGVKSRRFEHLIQAKRENMYKYGLISRSRICSPATSRMSSEMPTFNALMLVATTFCFLWLFLSDTASIQPNVFC